MGAMDDIYWLLVTIDYPDGVTGGLRRTTDALRAVLERTRGDLTTAMVAARSRARSSARRRPAASSVCRGRWRPRPGLAANPRGRWRKPTGATAIR